MYVPLIMNFEQIGPFHLSIPKYISYTKFSCEDYYGISLTDSRIDVLDNRLMGCRLNINGKTVGEMKDIPFHEGTYSFLTEGIICERT